MRFFQFILLFHEIIIFYINNQIILLFYVIFNDELRNIN